MVTEQVTELVTEIIEPVTEIVMVTQINEVTEQILVNQMDEVKAIDDSTEEILIPIKFLDEELKDECVTAALLGLDCLKESVATEQVTELVTEILEPVMEMVTQINEVTEQILVNQMDEGIILSIANIIFVFEVNSFS